MTLRNKRKTMFNEPRHLWMADTVRIDAPDRARMAAERLLGKFRLEDDRSRKVAIKRAVVNAANRAEAFLRKQNITPKERREMEQVAAIYRRAARKMELN